MKNAQHLCSNPHSDALVNTMTDSSNPGREENISSHRLQFTTKESQEGAQGSSLETGTGAETMSFYLQDSFPWLA